jgi:ferritin-like metal-binding protein YciE
MKHVKSLHELYVSELRDLYSAETQLIKALPKMVDAATSPSLQSALEEHLAVTEEQRSRLEEIFKELDESPKGKKCKGMEGLIAEAQDVLDETDGEGAVQDAGIIAAAQRVEHYEIAAYGTARTFAHRLGYQTAADLLQQTLDEEGEADKTLTEIAESEINVKATADGADEAEDE